AEGPQESAPPPAEAWEFAEGDEIVPGRLAVRRLGSGERYETYLAWDERLFALIVMKIIRPHLVEDDHSLDGLANEVRLLERLRHPVLLRAFDAVLEPPPPHVVLEHLEGPRLSTLIRRQRTLEPEQLLPLGLQLCSALHFLAAEGVVHLDVKPSNIIMGAPARLIDLSIARPVSELANVRHRIGTDAYMAPEQADPLGRAPITPAADVWGMGATLYHAAAGQPPFRPSAHLGHREERFPQLAANPGPLPPRVAPDVAALILACLDPHPARRPRPADAAAELEHLVDALPKRPRLGRFRVRSPYS
ncbi:MAG TPA: serine/threonine-protein kinase, partial [Gaiellaceae bacterium]|nr:serine/threonine-protein kinase [Gaiellaceae bacterium]